MKLYHILFTALAVLFFSCNKKNDTGNKILNQDNLPLQSFSININRDTNLVTKNGCIIKIPKGSLQSDSSYVKLEIKEAISISDIVMGGLTTMSGKQSLSSGGMIYINAANGYQVNIKKSLEVLVPTKNYNPDMKVYKAEQADNGKLDWIDPTPLPKDETVTKIQNGESLFKANCANYHKVLEDFTGPALYGITDRRSKQWIYNFTRNSVVMREWQENISNLKIKDSTKNSYIGSDYYSKCLFDKWNRTQMTIFPLLTDQDLDGLYAYVKTESDKHPELAEKFKKNCCDSCDAYKRAIYERSFKTDSLLSNEEFYNLNRNINISTTENNTVPDSTSSNLNQTYYTLNIDQFGWHNLDCLLKEFPDCKPSLLAVNVKNAGKMNLDVYLIIPSVKVFVSAEAKVENIQFGFYEVDGKTPLPENAICYIIAYGQNNGKIFFDKKAFLAKENQTIELTLNETSQASVKSQIDVMNISALKFEQIKKIEQEPNTSFDSIEIKKEDTTRITIPAVKITDTLDKLKPRNCDCDPDEPKAIAYNILK